jgi:acyl carrier protein
MPSRDEVAAELLEYLKREFSEVDGSVGLETPLISSGIVDSFSLVALKLFAERRYKVAVPDAEATPEVFDTVSRIADAVLRHAK